MANDLTPERIKRLEEIDRSIGAPIGWGVSHILRESKGEKGATFKERDDIGIAKGMGQIIPDTLSRYRKKLGNSKLNPFDPDDAITLYQAMMVDNTKAFGNYRDATRAYNAGWKKENWKYADKYMADIDENLKKYGGENKSSFTPKQILDNAVNKRNYVEQRQSVPKDAVMKKDTDQFIIDMNNFADNPNYTKPLTFDSYKEEVDKYLPSKEKVSRREVVVPYSKDNQMFGQANEMVNSYRSDIGKQKEKLEEAIQKMAKVNTKSDFAPIGRDTRGIAMMMDANAAASGGDRYLQPLLGNQAFTGVTPEQQARLLDEQERSKSEILTNAYNIRNNGINNIVNDQILDRNLYRGLTGDSLTAMMKMAEMYAPKKSGNDDIDFYKAVTQSRYPVDNQEQIVQKIQDALVKSRGY